VELPLEHKLHAQLFLSSPSTCQDTEELLTRREIWKGKESQLRKLKKRGKILKDNKFLYPHNARET